MLVEIGSLGLIGSQGLLYETTNRPTGKFPLFSAATNSSDQICIVFQLLLIISTVGKRLSRQLPIVKVAIQGQVGPTSFRVYFTLHSVMFQPYDGGLSVNWDTVTCINKQGSDESKFTTGVHTHLLLDPAQVPAVGVK